jgi:hypothetical protein
MGCIYSENQTSFDIDKPIQLSVQPSRAYHCFFFLFYSLIVDTIQERKQKEVNAKNMHRSQILTIGIVIAL